MGFKQWIHDYDEKVLQPAGKAKFEFLGGEFFGKIGGAIATAITGGSVINVQDPSSSVKGLLGFDIEDKKSVVEAGDKLINYHIDHGLDFGGDDESPVVAHQHSFHHGHVSEKRLFDEMLEGRSHHDALPPLQFQDAAERTAENEIAASDGGTVHGVTNPEKEFSPSYDKEQERNAKKPKKSHAPIMIEGIVPHAPSNKPAPNVIHIHPEDTKGHSTSHISHLGHHDTKEPNSYQHGHPRGKQISVAQPQTFEHSGVRKYHQTYHDQPMEHRVQVHTYTHPMGQTPHSVDSKNSPSGVVHAGSPNPAGQNPPAMNHSQSAVL